MVNVVVEDITKATVDSGGSCIPGAFGEAGNFAWIVDWILAEVRGGECGKGDGVHVFKDVGDVNKVNGFGDGVKVDSNVDRKGGAGVSKG